MPDIIPFQAYRYNQILQEKLFQLTAPLTETKFQQPESKLYLEPFHNYHIASPSDAPPFEHVVKRLAYWKDDKVIIQDKNKCIYFYTQKYINQSNNDHKVIQKSGILCLVKIHNYTDGVIIPHENVFTEALKFRKDLLYNLNMYTTPIHFIFKKNQNVTAIQHETLMDNLLYSVSDVDNNTHNLYKVDSIEKINYLQDYFKDQTLIIADGHHRYKSAVEYQAYRKQENPNHTGNELYNYTLAWITDSDQEKGQILPTHRLLRNSFNFDQQLFFKKVHEYFEILPDKDLNINHQVSLGIFKIVLRDKEAMHINLKTKRLNEYLDKNDNTFKKLEISLFNHFILEKCLGIKPEDYFKSLDYSHSEEECIFRVNNGENTIGFITKRPSVEALIRLTKQGILMPQKSTYFYPKVLSGLLFADVS